MLNAPNLRVGCPPFLTTPHFLMISTFLLNRRLCLALTLGSLIYLSLDFIGFQILNCPFNTLFSKPCPGCGMTRAVSHLRHGDVSQSFQYHLLAIPYLLLFSLIALAAILPYPQRNKLASAVEKSEKLTHWPALLSLSTIVYFLTRLIL
ncbi:DUF2752 domain-containing protein [Rubritalea tangerina]|uniref:DUF2752 domain-containing protein n=1 Tax=Rubritalea tangerina TaxID=430798 RepID=A0ABW4Z8N8_9BACT